VIAGPLEGNSMGIIEDNKTYTLPAIAEALGYRQSRTLERLLFEIECPVKQLGGKKLVSGKQFRLAIESKGCSPTFSAGPSSGVKEQGCTKSGTY